MNEKTHQKYPPSVQHGIPRLSPAHKGWKSFAIGKLVAEVIRPVEMDDDKTYTLVTAKRSRGGIVKREELKGREIAVKKQFYIQTGDFVISKRQIVHGACGFVPKELEGSIVSNEYLVLSFTDKVIPQFWDFLTHTIYFQQVCFHSSIGVHVEKMLFNVSRWYQWKVNIPTLKEQEKIASFLGAVDTRLTQLRRKHKLLQTYKRGVMQKIFSQQIRFKDNDGQPFPNWEKKKIKELGNVITGNTPSTNEKAFYNGNYLFVSPADIQNKRYIYETKTTLTEQGFKQGRLVKKSSILFVCIGSTIGKIAQAGKDCITNQQINSVIVNRENNSGFVYLVLQYQSSRIKKMAGEHAVPILNKSDFQEIKLQIPFVKEQERIADFFTAIDKKIEAVAQQIKLTEQFKKGLLQKIFV